MVQERGWQGWENHVNEQQKAQILSNGAEGPETTTIFFGAVSSCTPFFPPSSFLLSFFLTLHFFSFCNRPSSPRVSRRHRGTLDNRLFLEGTGCEWVATARLSLSREKGKEGGGGACEGVCVCVCVCVCGGCACVCFVVRRSSWHAFSFVSSKLYNSTCVGREGLFF